MSFLTPLFLLGGLAIGLPVAFHLIRRTTRDRTRFSSLMFLEPSPPRLTRKSRLEDLWLLLLRCLALGLIAFGFARPFLKKPQTAAPETAAGMPRVILLDTSASMRRSGLWSAARERVDAAVREAGPGDAVAVFTFDRQVTPRITFEEWSATPVGDRGALVERKLAGVEPGWMSTQLGVALTRAAEALVEREAGQVAERGRIVVISDLQEGSHLETLQSYEWPKGIELVLSAVRARLPGNASLQWVGDNPGEAGAGDDSVRVRVSNAADSKQERFQVAWASGDGTAVQGTAVEVYVPPGQSRMATLPVPSSPRPPESIVLRGDPEEFDNRVFLSPSSVHRSRVVYLGSEAASDSRQPLFFLRRAVPSTRRIAVEILARPPAAAPDPAEWSSVNLFVVTGIVSPPIATALRAEAEAGKTVLLVPVSATAAVAMAPLLGVGALSVTEGRPDTYAMMSEVDFRHPLFAPFADARFNDFTRLHFWKYRKLDAAAIPGARVVARFDRGDPALIEVPAGRGRIFILTSGWNPEDSQFALSTKFVPWIVSLLELSGGMDASRASFPVGEDIPLSAWGSPKAEGLTITGPGGAVFSVPAGVASFSGAVVPGLYSVSSEGRPVRQVAVNLDPVEGRTVPLAADELERLGAPSSVPPNTGAAAPKPVHPESRPDSLAAEGRQKLWQWFLAATLLILLVESGLSGVLARRSTPRTA